MWSSLRTNTISLQPEVIVMLTLGFPGPFHIVLRYTTPKQKGRAKVRARILVVDEGGSQSCCDCKWRACLPLAVFSSLHLACCLLINPNCLFDSAHQTWFLTKLLTLYSHRQLCVTLVTAEWSQSNSACWSKRWEAAFIPCGSAVH